MSFDASTDPDLSPLGDVLDVMQARADQCEVGLLLVGAAARDVLIRHVVGAPPDRATSDIDIAVGVESWADVDNLTKDLERIDGSQHKFRVRGIEVDIIPFGAVETADRTITWPDDHKMNVLGFAEAIAAAIEVRVSATTHVLVASLPAQAVLKLQAWNDRHYQDHRDAIDLRTILLSYSDGVHHEVLYTDHIDLLERYDFDPRAAGAHRLGHEARLILGHSATPVIALLRQLIASEAPLAADMGSLVRENRELLTAFLAGLNQAP